MGRKPVCLLILVFYLLAACTILSGKIEEEMTTLVLADTKTTGKRVDFPLEVDICAVYQDAEGEHLYEVREGTGWNQGLRCNALEGFRVDVPGGVVTYNATGTVSFVRAASRQPVPGMPARIVEDFDEIDDRYLYVYLEEVPEEWELPDHCRAVGQGTHSLLISVTGGRRPFLPQLAKTWTASTGCADSVYSLSEAAQLLEQLPMAAAAAAALASGLLFWVLLCLMIRREKSRMAWLSMAAMAAALGVMYFLLQRIDLPASMLPAANIFDFSHYRDAYGVILGELSSIPEADLPLISLAAHTKKMCRGILCAFAAAGLLLLLLFTRRKTQAD